MDYLDTCVVSALVSVWTRLSSAKLPLWAVMGASSSRNPWQDSIRILSCALCYDYSLNSSLCCSPLWNGESLVLLVNIEAYLLIVEFKGMCTVCRCSLVWTQLSHAGLHFIHSTFVGADACMGHWIQKTWTKIIEFWRYSCCDQVHRHVNTLTYII